MQNNSESTMNPLGHTITWADMQSLAVWEWSQQEYENIGGIISAGIRFPPSPPMMTPYGLSD